MAYRHIHEQLCARSFVLGCLQLQQNNLLYPCIDKHAQTTDPYQLAKRSVPAGSRSLILNMIDPHHVDAPLPTCCTVAAPAITCRAQGARKGLFRSHVTWPAPRPGRPAPAGTSRGRRRGGPGGGPPGTDMGPSDRRRARDDAISSGAVGGP